jgi:hypothetical protein
MEKPGLSGKAKRVRIYVSEGDLLHGLVSLNETGK